MALVINNAVAGPGVHALIIGVSDYINLPAQGSPSSDAKWSLNKLSSPALSAFIVYDFIRTTGLRLPLKTVRLLLSPSQREIDVEPRLANASPTRANRQALDTFAADWRTDAAQDPNDMTFFYFAGHGTQRGSDDAVLMLDDFLSGATALGRCFEIRNVKAGMAPSPSFPNIALTQFYFVDACLDRNAKLRTLDKPTAPEVLGVELNVVDRRAAPLFYSTVEGAVALGRSGKPSHFAEALTLAFKRAAEEADEDTGRWPVTATTIKNALDFYYTKNELGTLVTMGSLVGSPVIRYLPGPPDVDLSIVVQPDDLGIPCSIEVIDESNSVVARKQPGRQNFDCTVGAGLHRLQVNAALLASNPYTSPRRLSVKPSLKAWTHNLTQLLKPH